jgi:hypothetical protein
VSPEPAVLIRTTILYSCFWINLNQLNKWSKGEVVPVLYQLRHCAVKTYRGVEVQLRSWPRHQIEWVVISTILPLSLPGKLTRYPSDGPQRWSGCCGGEKNLLFPPGIESWPPSPARELKLNLSTQHNNNAPSWDYVTVRRQIAAGSSNSDGRCICK